MKITSYNRTNLILLILMLAWVTLILFIRAIPSLNSTIRFINNIKYEILGGYASDFFIQRNVNYAIYYNIINVLMLVYIVIISIVSIFKPKMIKILGIGIIVQNIFLLALTGWDKFLINKLAETILIEIKMYFIIISLMVIIFVLISFKQKIFYLILGTITLLQCLNTISIFMEYIGSTSNIHVILDCFYMIFILILYWALLFLQIKNNKQA